MSPIYSVFFRLTTPSEKIATRLGATVQIILPVVSENACINDLVIITRVGLTVPDTLAPVSWQPDRDWPPLILTYYALLNVHERK